MNPAGDDVLFHRLARDEFLRARRWYAKQGGEHLADRFRNAIDAAISRIVENPNGWSTFRQEYHWVRLKSFPYVLYYQILPDSRILILAVAHAARRPGYWVRRVGSQGNS